MNSRVLTIIKKSFVPLCLSAVLGISGCKGHNTHGNSIAPGGTYHSPRHDPTVPYAPPSAPPSEILRPDTPEEAEPPPPAQPTEARRGSPSLDGYHDHGLSPEPDPLTQQMSPFPGPALKPYGGEPAAAQPNFLQRIGAGLRSFFKLDRLIPQRADAGQSTGSEAYVSESDLPASEVSSPGGPSSEQSNPQAQFVSSPGGSADARPSSPQDASPNRSRSPVILEFQDRVADDFQQTVGPQRSGSISD